MLGAYASCRSATNPFAMAAASSADRSPPLLTRSAISSTTCRALRPVRAQSEHPAPRQGVQILRMSRCENASERGGVEVARHTEIDGPYHPRTRNRDSPQSPPL